MRSDEELMKAYRLGDLRAFEELYSRHRARVFGFLMKKCSSRTMAEEVFQATFMKLHESRARYADGQAVLPWIFVMARSAWIDRLRKDRSENAKLDLYRRDPSTTEFGVEEADDDRSLEELLKTLPKDHRELVQMRFIDELSFGEIAKRKDMKEAAVRQSISRLTRKLKKIFKES